MRSSNKKANVIIRSEIEYNKVALTFKVFPTDVNPTDPKGSSLAASVKSSAVSLILSVLAAVLFYKLQS